MRELVDRTHQEFFKMFQQTPELFSQAPGRINIIGEHTDYTGGLSLPAAINCWTVGAWRTRKDDTIRIWSSAVNASWETSWSRLRADIDADWKKYVAGSALLFAEAAGQPTAGFDLALTGNIPLGKGLSSSASIELTILNGLNLLFKKNLTPLQMAQIAQQVEHQFLNVKSGLLDQFASQFSKKDGALLIDFKSLDTRPVSLHSNFNDCDWVLVDSMVQRELSNSKYSERVNEYQTVLSLIAPQGKQNLREVSSQDLPTLLGDAAANLQNRARHIVTENERTLKAFECLHGGQKKDLGSLLYESHWSLSQDYEVSHPNLDFIVETASTFEGVVGGRMMGGGFGGCCLFLVDRSATADFAHGISNLYFQKFALQTDPRAYQFVAGASAWTHGN